MKRNVNWIPTNREGLLRLVADLDAVVADIERVSRKGKVHVYLDSAEVIAALDGATRFFFAPHGKVESAISMFESPATITFCLAQDGYLGQVRLLDAHRSEFFQVLQQRVSRLRRDGRSGHAAEPGMFARVSGERLRNHLQLDIPHALTEMPPSDPAARRDWLMLASANSEAMYKLASISRLSVLERVGYLRHEHCWTSAISGPPGRSEFGPIFGSKTYDVFYQAFQYYREHKPNSNSVDAVAIINLCDVVASGRRNKDSVRYIDTDGLFTKVIAEDSDGTAYNYLPCEKDDLLSSLVGPAYAYLAAEVGLFAPDFHHRRDAAIEQIRLLRQKLQFLSTLPSGLLPELLEPADLQEHVVGVSVKLLRKLHQFRFFRSVWLPKWSSTDEWVLFFQDSPLSEAELYNCEIPNELNYIEDRLKDDLRASYASIEEIANIWHIIVDKESSNRPKFIRKNPHPQIENVLLESGLIRFGLPPLVVSEAVGECAEAMSGVPLGNRDSKQFTSSPVKEGRSRLITRVEEAMLGRLSLVDLGSVFVVLWLLERMDAIRAVHTQYIERWPEVEPGISALAIVSFLRSEVGRRDDQQHIREQIESAIHKLSVFKIGRTNVGAVDIQPSMIDRLSIKSLCETLEDSVRSAYMWYVLADFTGISKRSLTVDADDRRWARRYARRYISEALRWGKVATWCATRIGERLSQAPRGASTEIRSDQDLQRSIYAHNLYLYLTAEYAWDSSVEEIEAAADGLVRTNSRIREVRSELRLWSYRYDDTLARSWYVQFLLWMESSDVRRGAHKEEDACNDTIRASMCLENAVDSSRAALRDGGENDDEVLEFYRHLQLRT